jgi:DNA gyrase/topoisomerase IV subunit A
MSEKDYVSPPPREGELTEVQAEAILNMRLRSLAAAGGDGASPSATR